MTIPAENHPGHTLLALPNLPPSEALSAWNAQLMADLNSRRTSGVPIHGGFIGSDLQDHGVESILGMLTLALASLINSTLADNNGDERHQPIDELMAEQFAQTRVYLEHSVIPALVEQLQTTYQTTLIEWEEDRRQQEADEEG